MKIQSHINSLFNSLSYRMGNFLVDAGDVWDGFEGVEAVLLTHGHFDHIYGLNDLLRMNPSARVFTNAAGRECLLSDKRNLSRYHESPFVIEHPENIVVVEDGEIVELGEGISARAVFTPGHNPSCITWVIGDLVFSGDSLIPGVKTVTNLPQADKAAAAVSEAIILGLAEEGREILPGHAVVNE